MNIHFQKKDATKVLKLITILMRCWGLGLSKRKKKIPEQVTARCGQRKARKDKDWQKADELRDKINEFGYSMEDTSEGQKLENIKKSRLGVKTYLNGLTSIFCVILKRGRFSSL